MGCPPEAQHLQLDPEPSPASLGKCIKASYKPGNIRSANSVREAVPSPSRLLSTWLSKHAKRSLVVKQDTGIASRSHLDPRRQPSAALASPWLAKK